MKHANMPFDWNQVRAFLATVEEGSLSAASRSLGLTQPTLSRQVAALEADLKVTLFERVGRSLLLTQSGVELLEHVKTMGKAANRISLTASGQSQTIEGQVSITASEIVSAYILPPFLEELHKVAPNIEVEIVSTNSVRDLTRREADIAIRHVRPQQPDLIAKLVHETTASLYASSAYLERHGRPQKPDDLSDAQFIGFESVDRILPALKAMGLSLNKDNFKLISNSSVVCIQMVRQGLGIGLMSKEIAQLMPDLELVFPQLEPISVPVWLTSHRELQTAARIRLVFDLLAQRFSRS